MKKIILGMASVALMGASISGGTYALFSSSGALVGNTISSGSVNLLVHNITYAPTGPLVPGQWSGDARLELYNTGTVPSKIYTYATNITGPGGICDKVNLKVSTGHAGGNEEENILYNGPVTAINGPSSRFEVTVAPPFDQLDPGISQSIHEQAQLDPSADNAQMGQSCVWDQIFVAENVTP